MTDRETFLALAERVEQAEGPDRALDIAIADGAGFKGSIHKLIREPKYTGSLDAAVALVPSDWSWLLRQGDTEEGRFVAVLSTHDYKTVTWGKGELWVTDVVSGQQVITRAATGPLALLAAALRARAAS